LLLLGLLQTLELLDQVEFELDGYPGGKLEGNILVGEGTPVTTGLGNQPDSLR
jgi:hypothetical protein